MRILTPTVLVASLVLVAFYASARPDEAGLAVRVAELELQVEELSEILEFVRVEEGEMNGLTGPHWIIEGANLHVRSGSRRTSDGCPFNDPNCDSLTGLGNLIVGYNEPLPPRHPGDPPREDRTGSHNLVVGEFHSYSSFGGFVAGRLNQVVGPNASVSGGFGSVASGAGSSISGGAGNMAQAGFSSVSGGESNKAIGLSSWVGGGVNNTAGGDSSSVSGGEANVASGEASSVSGGASNEASGGWTSVSGGRNNEAGTPFDPRVGHSGRFSSVSGGANRTAPNDFNWAAGSLLELD